MKTMATVPAMCGGPASPTPTPTLHQSDPSCVVDGAIHPDRGMPTVDADYIHVP